MSLVAAVARDDGSGRASRESRLGRLRFAVRFTRFAGELYLR